MPTTVTPYWETVPVTDSLGNTVQHLPRTEACDIAGRLDHILTNQVTGTPFNKPFIVADFQFVRQDLEDQNDDKIRPYVMFERTRLGEPDDICVSVQQIDDIYSLFLVYPLSALKGGSVSATKLEEIGVAVRGGFSAWRAENRRGFPSYVKNVRWYQVDQSWGCIDVSICIPYNTGMMDNPDVRNNTGVNWRLDINETNHLPDINPNIIEKCLGYADTFYWATNLQNETPPTITFSLTNLQIPGNTDRILWYNTEAGALAVPAPNIPRYVYTTNVFVATNVLDRADCFAAMPPTAPVLFKTVQPTPSG